MDQIKTEGNSSPFDGVAVISTYTREQAIEDGVLVPIEHIDPRMATESLFRWPVCLTDHVYSDVIKVPDHPNARGQSEAGRLWDVLWMCKLAVHRRTDKDEQENPGLMSFEVLATDDKGNQQLHKLWCTISGEGKNGSPVLTIMFPSDY